MLGGMTRIQKIVVALESNVDVDAVLEEAIDLAGRYDAKLILLRALNPLPMFAPSAILATGRVVTMLEESADVELRALAARAPAELVDDTLVRFGAPSQVICKVANDTRADVIVMGTTPPSGLLRRTGGSSARVAHGANCRVMIVPDRARRAA
jgi:nucleotide-binding universal stress UspA family protein